MNDLEAISRLVEALRPWLAQLVIVGGWAHRLHRSHPLADPPSYLPLLTRDADVAFSPTAALQGDMAAALKAAGFHEELSGEHTPPVSQYWLGEAQHGFYTEFLAPLRGSGVRRDGQPDATLVRAGVTAQRLRYMDLLLLHPLAVRLGREVGMPLEKPAEVNLANPASFIAQKLLIQKERAPGKRPQDVLYIHDTVELFGNHLDALQSMWRDQLRPSLAASTVDRVERLARQRFTAVDDVIRTAARIPQDRALTPERVRAVCAYGLETIYGTA
ncbi:GSU2403 family nucleotidyltransferase fold protein [Longimicrobium sp.]|uniref:GSU2403 family nucleotidyltransferase fold protein n=1 Tax=Longimicrobium sp. TaxID=2029185 RepID=UPI002BADFE0B|nr:GSU2403 family nucleotidyltransferase fold protein [Longimicrobium sp.]HSU15874.1 GSU2403 family nucleotidyltransferase fold protein [Longimicrobium sp.]